MNTPIGIIDSGSGGLTIWREIISLLPHESTVFIGDHKHLPYSKKTTPYIQNRVIHLIQFLLQKHAKIIVIACNTATVAGIDIYRTKFPNIPIVGVVPVIKTAARQSKSRHIAVLATEYTSKSSYQGQLIQKFASDCEVQRIGSTELVSLIENGDLTGSEIKNELSNLLSKIEKNGTDVLVLGCTHYPFVRDQIRAIVGEDVAILDSGGAVARQVERILSQESALSLVDRPKYSFYTTGEAEHVSQVSSQLLRRSIKVQHIHV